MDPAEFVTLDGAIESVFENCQLSTKPAFGSSMLGLFTTFLDNGCEESRQTLSTMLGWFIGGKDTDPGACSP